MTDTFENTSHFDGLIDQCGMALTYAQVTAEHGPDKQLILFIDSTHSLGLESLSLQDAHEYILNNTSPDTYVNMALEDLSTRAGQFGDFITNILRSSAQKATEIAVGTFTVGTAVAGKIAKRINDNTKVISHQNFEKILEIYNRVADAATTIKNAIPAGGDFDAWKAFHADHIAPSDSPYKEIICTAISAMKTYTKDKIPFAHADWTEQNFADAVKAWGECHVKFYAATSSAGKAVEHVMSQHKAGGERIQEHVANKAIVSAIQDAKIDSEIMLAVSKCTSVLNTILKTMKSSLDAVSKGFEEKE